MFNNINIGKYYPTDSFLHNTNSSTKTISVLLFLIGILISNSIIALIPFVIISVLIIIYSGVPRRLYFNIDYSNS
jgi:energy-coupling factor transport system permease protein